MVISKETEKGAKKFFKNYTKKKSREEMIRKGKDRFNRFTRRISDVKKSLRDRIKNSKNKREQQKITSNQVELREKREVETHFNAMKAIYESLSEQDKNLSVKELTKKTNELYKKLLEDNFKKFVEAVKTEKPELNVSELILEDVWILSATAAGVEGKTLDDERFEIRKEKAMDLLNEITNSKDDGNEHVNKFKQQLEDSIEPRQEEKKKDLDEQPKEVVEEIAKKVDCNEDDMDCIEESSKAKDNLVNINKVKAQYSKGKASRHDLNKLTENIDEEHDMFTFLKTAAETNNIKKQITEIKNKETNKIREDFDKNIINANSNEELADILKEYDDKLKTIVMVYNSSMNEFDVKPIKKEKLEKRESYTKKKQELNKIVEESTSKKEESSEVQEEPVAEIEPAPKEEEPLSKEEPMPKEEEPMPKKEEPMPKKEEPLPKKEEPLPKKEEKPLPKKEEKPLPKKEKKSTPKKVNKKQQKGGKKRTRRINKKRRTRKGGRKNVRNTTRRRRTKKSNKKRRDTRRR